MIDQNIEISFKVYANLDYGEELYLIGNIPALGSWKIENAIPLTTSSQEYPLWRLKKKLPNIHTIKNEVVYRYCIFLNGKFLRYEGDSLFNNMYNNFKYQTPSYQIPYQVPSQIPSLNSNTNLPTTSSAASISSSGQIQPNYYPTVTPYYSLPSMPSTPSLLTNEPKIENTYYYLHRLNINPNTNCYVEVINYFENMEKNTIENTSSNTGESKSNIENNTNNYLNKNDGVIMISYFLPIILYKELVSTQSQDENNLNLNNNDNNTFINSEKYKKREEEFDDENMIKKKNRVSFDPNITYNTTSKTTLNSFQSNSSTTNFSSLSRSQWRWRVKWDKEALLSLQLNAHVLWVGTIRYNNEEIPQEEEEEIVNILSELNCYPIFLNSNQHNQFFNQFCKQELWLVMHHMADVYSTSYLKEEDENEKEISSYNEINSEVIPSTSSLKKNVSTFLSQPSSSLSDKENILWYNYSQVHKKFVDKILEIYQPNYLISIHGFHLFLLPLYLRRKLGNNARIGYFFHTPFPSSELWKKIKYNKELLNGLLYCNLINFHCYEYLKHFQSTCFRILGYSSRVNSSGRMTLEVDGREIILSCVHVGVDLNYLHKIFSGGLEEEQEKKSLGNNSPSMYSNPSLSLSNNNSNFFVSQTFLSSVLKWKSLFPQKVIISGIDRLERLKGIPLRLIALDQFLTENPQWIGRVVFPLIGITASERGKDYIQTLFDVKSTINSLNKKFSKIIHEKKEEERKRNNENSIETIEKEEYKEEITFYFEEFLEEDFNLTKRLPYFASSDILLMAAARDGLNRYPIEFTLARKMHGILIEKGLIKYERYPGSEYPNQGLIILSEFISCARVMRGALSINPYRVEELKNALLLSLTMNNSERIERYQNNLEFSLACTTSTWISYVLSDLKNINKDSDEDFNESFNVGFGLNSKIMQLKQGFHYLDSQEIIKRYRNSRKRLILLDWGGTLVSNKLKNNKFYTFVNATRNKEENQGTVVSTPNDDFGSNNDTNDDENNEEELNKVKNIIEILCNDPKNLIFIVSGKEIHQVNDTFGMIRGLGLGAEHGYYHRWPRDELFNENSQAPKTRTRSSSSFSSSTLPFSSSSSNSSSTPTPAATTPVSRSRSSSVSISNQYSRWQMIQDTLEDTTWRDSAKILMDIFTKRTHGTYIEEKGKALIWQFSDADREFGYLQSKELEDHLITLFSLYPIEIIRGGGVNDGYIEVRPRGASKGLFFEYLLSCLDQNRKNFISSKKNNKSSSSSSSSSSTSSSSSSTKNASKEDQSLINHNIDFILAIGDDNSDEPLYEKINQLYNENIIEQGTKIFTVTVGKKPSMASSYLNDTKEVVELLESFTKTKERERKYLSSIDLVNNFTNQNAFKNLINRSTLPLSSNIHRASSVGSINYSDMSHRGTNKIITNPQQPKKVGDEKNIPHSVSQAHLSMSHYLDSIDSNNNQEDDSGIFF